MYLNSSSDGRVETKAISLKTWVMPSTIPAQKLEGDWETGEKVGLLLMGILDLLGDCNSLKVFMGIPDLHGMFQYRIEYLWYV